MPTNQQLTQTPEYNAYTSFALNEAEVLFLSGIREAAAPGWQAAAYRALLGFISAKDSNGVPTGPLAGVDASVWQWIKGACEVNSGVTWQGQTSTFSDFIREYTEGQYFLRTGNTLGATAIQSASNSIADAVVRDVLNIGPNSSNPGHYLPTIERIGAFDAGAVAATVFGSDDDFSPWAGSILFSGLGVSEFVTSFITSDSPTLSPVDSTYSAMAAFQAAKITALGLGVSGSVAALWDTINVTYNLGTYSGWLGGWERLTTFIDVSYGVSSWSTTTFDLYKVGTFANDTITTNNAILGLGGDDIVHGGAGNDTVVGSTGDDIADGGAGYDTLSFESVSNDLLIRSGTNSYTGHRLIIEDNAGENSGLFLRTYAVNFETLKLSNTNDKVELTDIGPLTLIQGMDGNDTFTLSNWSGLTVDGGSGTDILSYENANGPLLVNLSTSVKTLGGEALDPGEIKGGGSSGTLLNIEGISGTDSDDFFYGSAGADNFAGGKGNDTLTGGAGSDVLNGGSNLFPDDIDVLDYKDSPGVVRAFIGLKDEYGNPLPDTVQDGWGTGGVIYTDTISNFEKIVGSNFNDYFEIRSATNIAIDGGAGTADRITFENYDAPVIVAPNIDGTGRMINLLPGGFSNVEIITGSAQDDLFFGQMGSATYAGKDGNDTFISEKGGHTSAIRNAFTGGAGVDTFYADGVTTISDFQAGEKILLAGHNLYTQLSYTVAGGGGGFTAIEAFDPNGLRYQTTVYSGMTTAIVRVTDLYAGGTYNANYSELQFTTTSVSNLGGGSWSIGGILFKTAPGSSGGQAGMGDAPGNNQTGSDTAKDTMFGDNSGTTFNPGGGDDVVMAQGGDDTIIAGHGGGNDYYDGGDGVDTIKFESTTLGVVASLKTGTATGSEIDFDYIRKVENIWGGSGGDTLTGNAGANVLKGNAGADTLIGEAGNDTLDGGADTDKASYASSTGVVYVNLASTSQTLGGVAVATSTALDGLGGTDTLTSIENAEGGTQADYIMGSTGNNQIWGGAGDDTLYGGDGNDRLIGGAGNDTLDGGNSGDYAEYTDSTSGILVNLSNVTLTLGGVSLDAHTVHDGLGGIDTLVAIENIRGSEFADNIYANYALNTLLTYGGNDIVFLDTGADYADGGSGVDLIDYATAGNTVLVNISSSARTLNGTSVAAGTALDHGGSVDTLISFENVNGSAYNDWLYGSSASNIINGGSGNDQIWGDSGSDTLRGYSGNDTLDGGSGTDTADFGGGTSSAYINISSAAQTAGSTTVQAGQALDGFGGTDTLTSIENIIGTGLNDTIWGSTAANVLDGGAGWDTLTGGSGADQFIWRTGGGNDTVTDYTDGTDTLRLLDTGATYSNLTFANTGSGATVTFSGSVIFTLTGVNMSVLDSSDFLFV